MPGIINATPADELLGLVRTEFRNLPIRELLRQSPQALLGVSPTAAAVLKNLEISSVFDLATSAVFAAAAKLLAAGTDLGSVLYQHGAPTADLVREAAAAGKKIDELRFLSIDVIECIPAAHVSAVQEALDVQTVRDLALYPPHRAAVRLLTAAYFPENAPTFDPERPADLLPKTGEYPTERVQYTTLLMDAIATSDGASITDIAGPDFQPLDLSKLAAGDAGFKKIAHGALLTINQSWYAQGVTLGHLLHSTSLAPGESTRVAVIDWSRKSRAGETEVISEADELAQDTSHNRAINEVTQAVAREAQSGFSEANSNSVTTQTSTATADETSAPLFGLLGGPSGSEGETSSAATSSTHADGYSTTTGRRDIGSSMLQGVNDRTHQNAHSSRSRRASVVKEVSQLEHEEVSTRVLANYNHMHALTIQYYEVVQVYRVEVAIAKADKVVFIPVQLLDFANESLVRRFQNVLARAALSHPIREALRNLDMLEITPERETHFTLLGGGLTAVLRDALATRTSLGVARTSIPATVDEAAADPAVRPTAMMMGASPLSAVRLSVARPVFRQVNDILWSADQAARLSGLLNRAVLRGDSNAVHLPTDVSVEGGVVTAGGAAMNIVFHTVQGTTVTAVSADRPLALSDVSRIGVIGGSAERELSASVTLTLNRNGVRFPLDLPSVTVAKGNVAETFVVRVRAGGVNANLQQHLNDNRMYYSQAAFRSLDGAQIALLLAGYGVEIEGILVPIAQVVEPRPIRYIANFLAFKMNTDSKADKQWATWLGDHGIVLGSSKEDIIPLPSGGTFAEAVLGRSNCAEKLDITRFWNWQDSPIPLQPSDIAAIQTGSRATQEDTSPGQLSNPIINITSPGSLPDPTGTAAVLAAIQNGNMFRDMSGLQSAIGLAQAALQATAAGATAVGEQAGTNMNNLLKANTERQRIAADLISSIVKTATGSAGGGGTGGSRGSGAGGLSGDGARINHGRSMDDRGVPGPAGAPTGGAASGASGGSKRGNGGGSPAGGDGGGGPAGGSPAPGVYSHEATYADRAALGYSPDAINAVIGPTGEEALLTPVTFSRDDMDAARRYGPNWLDLLQFRVPSAIVTALAARDMAVQRFQDAAGVDLNLDMYPVRVTRFPTVGGEMLDAIGLLRHMRLHINDFVNTDLGEFHPYDDAVDGPIWASNDPTGAVINIDIGGPDNAAVVTSLALESVWRFSTIRTPDTGSHPVSGNREWGFTTNEDGSTTFYTRGADRTSEAMETLGSPAVFFTTEFLWGSLQDNLVAFVNDNGGEAVKVEPFSRRIAWEAVRIVLHLSNLREI